MELWDAYDCQRRKTGETLVRGEAVPAGRYHLVCGFLVEHQDGTFLMMKRDPHKESWPDVYEASGGGSVMAGETSYEAALRELKEETGIEASSLIPLYEECRKQSLYDGYLCRTDWPKDRITLQEGETVAYRWVTAEKMHRMMQLCPPVCIIQRGVQVYLGFLEDGQENLKVFLKKDDRG